MEKILILSDSHGNVNNMILAVKQAKPDCIIHLGDCWADAQKLKSRFPEIPMEQVPGNCDCSQEFQVRVLLIEGKRVMICHGHTYNVKAGYLTLEMGALEKEADIVLFGHTHYVFYDHHNGLFMLNPGSIGAPRYGNPPSYGVLTLDESTGAMESHIFYLE
ncbi:MAG: metallophosphoesterase [Agathobacter sp.]|nr:metallophosphoesterase [Agathobacter sp.]